MTAAVTDELIGKWRAGDPKALQQLLPLIYQELHRIARRHLQEERSDHTLQPTALVHEAYLRLVGMRNSDIQDHCHFVALASRLMRQVLIDHARAHLAAKRQGGIRITLSEALDLPAKPELDLLAVDEALERLSHLDQQQAHVVELRFRRVVHSGNIDRAQDLFGHGQARLDHRSRVAKARVAARR